MSSPPERRVADEVRRVAGNLFIDQRRWVELGVLVLLVGAFLVATGADNFDVTLSDDRRATLYGSVASTAGALLGFVLTALAILVALPSTERMEKLRGHPRWARVPDSYFRAARALLAAVVLSTLGIALDSAEDNWLACEVATVVVLALSLIRVTAAVVVLDQVLAVARAPAQPASSTSGDPGP